jgi:hypothetical protein
MCLCLLKKCSDIGAAKLREYFECRIGSPLIAGALTVQLHTFVCGIKEEDVRECRIVRS